MEAKKMMDDKPTFKEHILYDEFDLREIFIGDYESLKLEDIKIEDYHFFDEKIGVKATIKNKKAFKKAFKEYKKKWK